MTFFYDGKLNNIATTVVRREVLNNSADSIWNEKKIHIGEDRLQLLYALLASDLIMYIPESFYYYIWRNNSQGGAVRSGMASPSMYNDFKIVWQHERKCYSTIGFSKTQCAQYDCKKLNRIASLVEGIFVLNTQILSKEKKKFINEISKDALFQELAIQDNISCLSAYKKYLIELVRKNNFSFLNIYLKVCKILKNINSIRNKVKIN